MHHADLDRDDAQRVAVRRAVAIAEWPTTPGVVDHASRHAEALLHERGQNARWHGAGAGRPCKADDRGSAPGQVADAAALAKAARTAARPTT